MELFPILTVLSVILFCILLPSANSQQILVNYSHQEQADHELQITVLPRKLIRKVMEDANVKSVEPRSNVHVLQNKPKETLVSGRYLLKASLFCHHSCKVFLFRDTKNGDVYLQSKFHQKKEDSVHAKKGTWQEWKEGTDSSQFFSMDYSHVSRRRPIHNKFTTVVAP